MNRNLTTSKLTTFAVTALVTCAGAGLLATNGASASAVETLSFRGVLKPVDEATIDVKPAGDSLGDRSIASMTLRRGGEVAGRLEGVCTTVDNTYEGHMCTLVVILKDGRIAFEGAGTSKVIPNVGGRGDVFAVTGGTGRYVGAAGTMEVGAGTRGDRIVISLR